MYVSGRYNHYHIVLSCPNNYVYFVLIWIILFSLISLARFYSPVWIFFYPINKVSIACKTKLYAVFTSFRFFANPFFHGALLTARSFRLLFCLHWNIYIQNEQHAGTLFDWKTAVAVWCNFKRSIIKHLQTRKTPQILHNSCSRVANMWKTDVQCANDKMPMCKATTCNMYLLNMKQLSV